MTIEDSLSRLSAGLDRDEQLAGLTPRPDWDATPEGTVWDSSSWVADVGGDLAEYVAHFDPARALRQVEAIRELVADYNLPDEEDPRPSDEYGQGVADGHKGALRMALSVLAGIYTEEPSND